MIRKISIFGLLVFIFGCAFGQVLKPATWQWSLEKIAGEEYEIRFRATIDEDWYLYSSDFDPDLGPMITTFAFQPDPSFELIGGIAPQNPKRKYDSLWEGEYTYFVGQGLFTQRVRLIDTDYKISGTINYQVCTDVDGKCIPFEEEFTLVSKPVEKKPTKDSLLASRSTDDAYSLWAFMLAAFLAGLAALLTPCVFPLIPLTVSFFTNQGKGGNGVFLSLLYGFSIVLIYVLIGSLVAPFMGPEVANDLATGWIPNLIFFTVFVLFALSFFGLFEITLPNSWVNKVDQLGDRGGVIGVFFMAFTLVLVSFSCTGPIVGSILVESAGGQVLKPILGMLAFASAFAIPFTLFALFPGWVKALPKSGGWLNSVKVVLGFLELAFAFKFLSIADQAYHWGILDREVFLAIWIVIFTLLGFYLLGKIKLPGDDARTTTSVWGLLLAIGVFTFVTYLIPGMFGAPLNALAGYLPPVSSHGFNLKETRPQTVSDFSTGCEPPKYADFLHWPHGLNGYFDLEQAKACAKATGKPIFVDFTGHGCVNCREMEQRVWSDPQVLEMLSRDFVLVALYVDDKTELPEAQWYQSTYDQKWKKTIGKQNADFQIVEFQNNAQPFYLILDAEGNLLTRPQAYDLDTRNFTSFLAKGLAAHQAQSK